MLIMISYLGTYVLFVEENGEDNGGWMIVGGMNADYLNSLMIDYW